MVGLYHWHLEKVEAKDVENSVYIAHGIVTGHPCLPELRSIHTSIVTSIARDPTVPDGVLIQTQNTKYVCPMKECDYEKCGVLRQEEHLHVPEGFFEWLSRLDEYAARYAKPKRAETPEGAIMLRLGANRQYYFESMEVRMGDGEILSVEPHIHGGSFQDSVICLAHGELPESENYDLRYFPYQDGNIAFYVWRPNGRPVYLENVGDRVLRIRGPHDCGIYVIQPGECRQITPETADPGAVLTSRNDLYNAWDLPPIPMKTVVGEDGQKHLVRLQPEKDNWVEQEDSTKAAEEIYGYDDKNGAGGDG